MSECMGTKAMKKKDVWLFMRGVSLLFVLWRAFGQGAVAADRPPNIVFILADDLGYGDLGCFGQKRIRTPHLDRMASEGMRLTRHYSGNAVCAPSRCVLMTGRHPGHAFIRDNRQFSKGTEGQYPVPEGTVTIARLLRECGYATGGFGKWGLGGPGTSGEPLRQGFDRWFGYNCQAVAHNFYPTHLWDDARQVALKNPAFPAHDRLKEGEAKGDAATYARFSGPEYSADLIAEKALDFVRTNRERPFFLYWPTTVPHLALQVPEDSLREYDGQFEEEPYPGGKGYLPHRRPRSAYAAMVTRMDREIGRMMALVAELGLDEKTLFVFTSDNGPLHGTHQGLGGTDAAFFESTGGLRDGKGTLWEGGFRVPTIVRWKGTVAPGGASDGVSGFEDWMPTLVEVAGGRVPEGLDGVSLLPTLRGRGQGARPFLYREFSGYLGYQVVMMERWKAVRRNLSSKKGTQPGDWELYDVVADRSEEKDVASEHPEMVARAKEIAAREHVASTEFPFPVLDR
jgi:arylsulfatase A-like enzyme